MCSFPQNPEEGIGYPELDVGTESHLNPLKES